ncbi:MAG: FtsX-like permease family protein [Acidobacteriota bacterium]
MGVLRLLAGRYLLGLRRRTHVATVSMISFSGMALGAAALVITLAMLEGFQATIREQLTRTGVHAELRPAVGATLPGGEWLARLRARHPELDVRALASGAVWCTGADATVPATLELAEGLGEVEVNRVLAARLGVGAGLSLTIVSPRLVLTPLGPMPRRVRVEIGTVREARPGDDRAVIWAPPELGRALLDVQGLQSVELRSSRPELAWEVASVVQGDLPEGVEVVSFRELNRPLLAALQLERSMIGLGVALVIVVAALNLLCNLALLAAEKRADVTLLAALGLDPARVRSLFIALGLGIGALGGLLGTALGAGVATVLDRTHAVPLPRGIFVVSHVPFRVTAGQIGVVLAVSLTAALLASLVPARAAARREISAGLRYE